jgi:hypothetical protein
MAKRCPATMRSPEWTVLVLLEEEGVRRGDSRASKPAAQADG